MSDLPLIGLTRGSLLYCAVRKMDSLVSFMMIQDILGEVYQTVCQFIDALKNIAIESNHLCTQASPKCSVIYF